ncbi:aminotransferase class V-fold PLP-dependent enzyme [Candidatus Sumerlaeota bacterium]|nr:aminotransferase class V-fold PLP-dependent enzyme [Candidatus Sumerlaeota bacterium]
MLQNVPDFRNLVIGLENEVSLLDGRKRPYVNFDNAATTPPFKKVLNAINEFSGWYSSIHRGTGYKSLLSTRIYNQCREIVANFIGADPAFYIVIFCGNATDAINRVCRRLNLENDQVVLTTIMEHHSNQLPWRFCGNVDYVEINARDGTLDLDDLKAKLEKYNGRVRLVTVTGTSNITGVINPVHDIARMVHEYDALFLVDAAQLIAHRALSMGDPSDPGHIDFLAFSAHKMYAPFGSGVLAGPRDFFRKGPPAVVGGGAVELVTTDEILWSDAPNIEEAGSPNFFGVLGIAKAIQVLQEIGMEKVAAHDRELTRKTLRMLVGIPGIRIFGDPNPDFSRDRSGVIPILSEKHEHGLLASILGYEWGIGVRHGCFCAHTYLTRLFGLTREELERYLKQVRLGNSADLPGLVRISFALYNTLEEVEYLEYALKEIMNNNARFSYIQNPGDGEYYPQGREGMIGSPFLL